MSPISPAADRGSPSDAAATVSLPSDLHSTDQSTAPSIATDTNVPQSENPFVSFRRFMDEQFNSLSSDVSRSLGMPSEFSDHRPNDGNRSQPGEESIGRPLHIIEPEWFAESRQRQSGRDPHGTRTLEGQDRAHEPVSELDLYDQLGPPEPERQEPSWMGGSQWDARYTRQNLWDRDRALQAGNDTGVDNTARINDFSHLDIFNNRNDLEAFLRHSSYSPLHLENETPTRTGGPSGYEGSLEYPFQYDRLKAELANRVCWRQAFDDLLLTEKLEQAQSKDLDTATNTFPFEDIIQTLAGPFWRVMKQVSTAAMEKDKKHRLDMSQGQHWDGDIEVSPLCTSILALLTGALLTGGRSRTDHSHETADEMIDENKDTRTGALEELTMSVAQTHPDTLLDLIHRARQASFVRPVPEEAKVSTESIEIPPTTQAWSTSSYSSSSWSTTIAKDQDPNSIISTLTTTQVRTLPDGASETRRVLKKRFADGREENSESVETKPAQRIVNNLLADKQQARQTTTSEKAAEEGNKKRPGSGWFWN